MRFAVMHVGGAVADLRAAMAEHERFGVGPWTVTAPRDFVTYDHAAGRVVRQRLALAFGRLPGGGAIELVGAGDDPHRGPQWRLLRSGAALSHVAYWCPDVPAAIAELVAGGAAIETLPAPDAAPRTLDERIAAARTGYLLMPSGLRVELVDTALWGAPLRGLCGAGIEAVLDPPGHLST
ncbi:VOC family protein [Phytohabitans sp. ZYX-F-186]|uniref:VOC family protein n=1 Tax=Phytohabitans maris TaxID=3071409 RepID=A0ABU0Z9L0_9ACTN|nr:VOC family protein [Phytohabitans sp. ZYX-F-186]MDQ7903719.1 VOC family protein [Phytohabitans sp. ZYX-F-186]